MDKTLEAVHTHLHNQNNLVANGKAFLNPIVNSSGSSNNVFAAGCGQTMNENKEEQMKRRIKNELKPFLEAVINGKANLPEMDYHVFRLRWAAMGDMFFRLIGIPNDLEVETKGIAHDLFAYLGLVESLGNTLIDMISMLIIANGVDLHMECYDKTPRIRHVKSTADLKRVALSTKLNFLRDNGIKEIPSIIDSKLRNDIAHLNFTIDEKNIYIRGQPAQQQVVEGLKKLNALFFAYDELLRIDPLAKEGTK